MAKRRGVPMAREQGGSRHLAHAGDDALVPVANTLRLREALIAAKVPVETHLFARGGHGFGARQEIGRPGDRWLPSFLDFAREEDLLREKFTALGALR